MSGINGDKNSFRRRYKRIILLNDSDSDSDNDNDTQLSIVRKKLYKKKRKKKFKMSDNGDKNIFRRRYKQRISLSDWDSDTPLSLVRGKLYKKIRKIKSYSGEKVDDEDTDCIIKFNTPLPLKWGGKNEIKPVELELPMKVTTKEEQSKISDGYDAEKNYVDRIIFPAINVKNHIMANRIVRHTPIETNPPQELIVEDPTFCGICLQTDREDRMLLCNGCNLGYHLECLTPPLSHAPIEEWFCPDCSPNSQANNEAVDSDRRNF